MLVISLAFHWEVRIVFGDVYLAYKIDNETIEEVEIKNSYNPEPPIWNSTDFMPDSSYRTLLTQMYINAQVVSQFHITVPIIDSVTHCSLPLMADNFSRYYMSDFIQMANTHELFNEVIPFVKVRQNRDGYKIVVFDKPDRSAIY